MFGVAIMNVTQQLMFKIICDHLNVATAKWKGKKSWTHA